MGVSFYAVLEYVMYDLPNDSTVKKVILTKDSITKGEKPLIMHDQTKKSETA